MEEKYLPRGYYAVLTPADAENSSPSITVGQVTYALRLGVDAFADIGTAQANAVEIPDTVLPGLPYARFDAPVILFAPGKHKIDKHVFDRSLILLGANAGVAPDIYGVDGETAPVINPARGGKESILYGSFWYGHMTCADSPEGSEPLKSVTYDGLTLEAVRIIVNVKKSENFTLSLRNLIYKGPCGNTMITSSGPADTDPCLRSIILDEVSIRNFDGYDYGGSFIRPVAGHVSVHHLCFTDTDKPFGFTDYSRRHDNSPKNSSKIAEIEVSDSYFENIGCTGGISLSAGRPVSLVFSGCGFKNASTAGEAVLQPRLGAGSQLTVQSCRFEDSRGCPSVVEYLGDGEVVFSGNITEGFINDVVRRPEPPICLGSVIETPKTDYETREEDPHTVLAGDDFSALDSIYCGRTPRYGDLHVHSNSGGTSDGKTPIGDYTRRMDEIGMDFAAIVDHKQMRHMFLPEFDRERMICGSEPGTTITSGLSEMVRKREIHYNMIFPDRGGLAKVLAAFPEFEWAGGELDGSFKYPKFTRERFIELAEFIRSLGGCLVHAHPKQIMASGNPLDYYFGEHTYIEVLHGDAYTYESYIDYKLWRDLLALGRHVYAAGGSDAHGALTNGGVSVMYSAQKSGAVYELLMYDGDFTVGYTGIKMCLDKKPMGSEAGWHDGMVLYVSAGDFFGPYLKSETVYELRVLSDRGIIYRREWSGEGEVSVRIKAQKRAFYRAEVFNKTRGCPVAVGNPIFIN